MMTINQEYFRQQAIVQDLFFLLIKLEACNHNISLYLDIGGRTYAISDHSIKIETQNLVHGFVYRMTGLTAYSAANILRANKNEDEIEDF